MLEFETRNSRYQFDVENKLYRSCSLHATHRTPWCEWHPYVKLGIDVASFVAQGRRSLFIYLPGKEDDPIVTSYLSKIPAHLDTSKPGYIG